MTNFPFHDNMVDDGDWLIFKLHLCLCKTMLNNLVENSEEFNNFVEEQRSFLTPDKVRKKKKVKTNEHKWQVTEIQERHHKIKNLLFLGYQVNEIAELLNCSVSVVSNVKNSPIIKDQLSLMQTVAEADSIDVMQEIKNTMPAVMHGLAEVINKGTLNGEPVTLKVRINEFNNMLDRYIGKPTQNVKTSNINVHFTKEELDEMKLRAMEVVGGN